MNILTLDIETSPMVCYAWRTFKENIAPTQIIQDSQVLSWAAKWHHDKKVLYDDARNHKSEAGLISSISELVDQADMVIAHNGQSFDMKVISAQEANHQITPPSDYRMVDTLKITKKYFRLPSYKLEYLTNRYNKKYKKLKHDQFPGFELWKEVMNNNKKAWTEMEKYNKYDVLALEEYYFGTLFDRDVMTRKWLVKKRALAPETIIKR